MENTNSQFRGTTLSKKGHFSQLFNRQGLPKKNFLSLSNNNFSWSLGRDLDPRQLPYQEPKLFFNSRAFQGVQRTKVGIRFYVVHSLLSSFALHWSQRSECGLSKRLWLTYIGYCVQFLHQCHLSKSLPLTYSTILNQPE